MIHYQEAQQIILAQAKPFATESIALSNALGRTLAETIVADRDYPPFNRATMDGFAFNHTDFTKSIKQYQIIDTIFAGSTTNKILQQGECYKIMTGAAVPTSANVVIRREDTSVVDNLVTLHIETCKLFQNIAKQGEDITAATSIITSNKICTPAVISVLAALGKSNVTVKRLPSVSIFTTGNEIVPVDTNPIDTVQIRNSNQYLLKALLQQWQIQPSICKHLQDDKAALTAALSEALPSDIIIINGGVSAGDADYVPEVLTKLGVALLFHKIAIRPGKPLWCGKLPNGGVVFALPGNPFSCMVTFQLFIKPYLLACFGLPQQPFVQLPLAVSKVKNVGLDEFFPAQIQAAPISLMPLQFKTSGDVKATLFADGIALHPSSSQVLEANTIVHYLPFNY
jgi:molybdopterin molybdotransferase